MHILRYLVLFAVFFGLVACQEPTPVSQTPTTLPDPTVQKTAQTTTAPPILQIDPGGHKALIRDVTFTPDGGI
ncbi:hypothetical protein BGP_2219 [Beggiatoa sp. PS]|nr:hypothetical protein BGP_2219 [Beggiatoa sp. PS]